MEPKVQKYENLNKLSTSELEQQLRDDERGRITLSPEEITQILTILEQRETDDQPAPQYPEPHEQWQQIKSAYENQKATTEKPQETVDLSEGNKNRVARKRHAWRPFVAAMSAAALIALIIIPAEGFEGVFQTLAEWTSNVFYFFTDDTGGGFEFGPVTPYVDEDGSNIAIEYTGEVLELEYYAWGAGTATDFGILLFVDGEPQPFYTDSDSEMAYMHYFSIEEDYGTIYFTLYFTPVTGQAGDTLTLTVCAINNAQYQPDMVETTSYAGYHDSLEFCPDLHFAATPEAVAWADTVEAMSNVSISTFLMTEDFAESQGHETEELEDWAYCTVYYDGLTQYDNLDVTDQETVHVTILLYGGPAGDTYCVTCYANHQVLTNGENTTQKITIDENEIVSLEFDLETSQLDDLTTFYAYICPVSTNEEGIGMKTSSILFYRDS